MIKAHFSWLNLLIAILLFAVHANSAPSELHSFAPLLSRYFPERKPSSYFVSIESTHEFSSTAFHSQVFQGWFGLRVSQNHGRPRIDRSQASRIQEASFVLGEASSQIAVLGADGLWSISSPQKRQESGSLSSLTITLLDLCKKYFAARPVFLLIERENLPLSAVNSQFWEDPECGPEVLLLKPGVEIHSYLLGKQWDRKQTINGYSLYVHQKVAFTYQQILEKSYRQNGQILVPKEELSVDDILQFIKKAHSFQPGKKDEQLLSVFDINSQMVSIPDILDKSAPYQKDKYIFLRSYSSKKSMLFLDRYPQQYETQAHQLKHTGILNITLLGDGLFPHILVAHRLNQSIKIFEEELRKEKCQKYHVDEQVFVNIRGGAGSLDPQVQKEGYVDQALQDRHKSPNAGDGKPAEPVKVDNALPKLPQPSPQETKVQKVQKAQKAQKIYIPQILAEKTSRPQQEGVVQEVSKKQQPQPDTADIKKVLIVILIIVFSIVLVVLIIRQLIIKKAESSSLKLRSKIKKAADVVFEQISISESDQGLEMKE